jgi:hypothetical protein
MDYFIGQVGIDPDKFWKHTWKENHLLGEAYYINHNKEWERIRYLATMGRIFMLKWNVPNQNPQKNNMIRLWKR